MIVHFVCRGNAFRSIFAEACLNAKQLPNVQTISSGTRGEIDRAANEPNFQRSLEVLRAHNLERFAKDHHGDQLTPERLAESDVVVFVNQVARDEYRGPEDVLPAKTFVWDIPDIGENGPPPATPEEARAYRETTLQEISHHVDALAAELRSPR